MGPRQTWPAQQGKTQRAATAVPPGSEVPPIQQRQIAGGVRQAAPPLRSERRANRSPGPVPRAWERLDAVPDRDRSGTGGARAGGDISSALQLVGANPAPHVRGVEELPGTSNYFIGNDPQQWRTAVPSYAKVVYDGIYPGVDLVYYGTQGRVEHDFVVAPGTSPSVIAFDVHGADQVPSMPKATWS